ncbi:hypothetical protein [Shuttleworthella satelles]|uniref:Uncharacterized protein n=1 Tax=Shuttleworthella satelles DSM 14600 TaxID=626523 RepID=C4GAA1_9FIRM|nr:hypothetical protein [Shuttleworthia satelles]EEP28634.1 hypothetical protein GCWU000342_01446 [Shuttleworthia satelles DSM 14600]
MSQEKVDRNKEAKRNIKKTLKVRRRRRILGLLATVLILFALVGGGGFYGYQRYQAYQKTHMKSTVVDLSEISNYLSSVTAGQESK